MDTGYRTHRPQDYPGYRTIIIPLAWTAPESPLSIKDLTRHTELSDHPLARPVTAGIGIGIGIGTVAKTVRRTRHTLHCRHLSDNNTPSLTADPYGQPPCTPAGLFILWHHYRRPRSRKRPTVASKHLQDLRYLPHPGISGHTSSRSRVSPAESLASLLRSPSSGQQRRLCCQRLQGRPLIWLISQSQTFRGPRDGTAQIAIPRYLSRNSTRHCYQRLCKSQEELPYSSLLLLLFCHHIVALFPSCTALLCTPRIYLPPASSIRAQSCNSCSQVHLHARHLSTSTRLSITPIFSLLHIRTAPAHP